MEPGRPSASNCQNAAMFRLLNVEGQAALEVDGAWYAVDRLGDDPALSDPMQAIARFAELHELTRIVADADEEGAGALVASARLDHTDVRRLGPAVPNPSKVIAIGLNYRSHAQESNLELPPSPIAFTKFPSCLAGPRDDIELSGDRVDWEVELVVVIGIGGRRIEADRAWSHVAGVTLGQDISDRAVQLIGSPPQFSLGKSFDTFGPIGPAVVSVDSFDDPDDIELWCEVDDERMQHSRTSDLIFGVPELVASLSAVMTLCPGDVIFTGTPGGVGMGRGRFLRPGNVVSSVAVGIGELANRCVAPG